MSEMPIQKVEKQDIQAPHLDNGESAIVFQRHEMYERDRTADRAGSLQTEYASAGFERNVAFFKELFSRDTPNSDTMVLFVASDTQYAGKGYRSMETAQLAQDAAVEVLESMHIDPRARIINLNPEYTTQTFDATGQPIRPDQKIREPQIFDTPGYVGFLQDKYGEESGPGAGMSTKAWAAHEMDAEKEVRELFGAEGVRDMLDRTKKSLRIMERYAGVFHANNPHKKLLIWATSHYDTISPLVKDATGIGFDEYLPVDYGAGVVIELKKNNTPALKAQNKKVALRLGDRAITNQE